MRKIAVFTGTRAEYGLLYWLMKEIEQDGSLELQLIVSGMHLSPEFGETVTAIEQDGFTIDARVEMLLSSGTGVGIAKSMGVGTIGFADALDRLRPDWLVVLGDRFEALSIAQTAMVMQIPLAHIHGGELTEGLIDEAIRHAITKMAQLHFTSTERYRSRVIQLGEQPDRVINVGAPAIENILRIQLLDQTELEHSLKFKLGERPLLVTYHPVTLKEGGGIESLRELLSALEELLPETKIVLTFPNADAHGRELIPVLQIFAKKYPESVLLITSLGQIRYLSLMKICGAVVGNSSSGLLEAPAMGVPTVDIGIRQRGRLKPESVVQAEEDLESIRGALKIALSPAHRQKCIHAPNPYGDGHVAKNIVHSLRSISGKKSLFKVFYDLEF
ncbi:UDP-N-acetylglucosamine 2-epimerase (hydrolyzing) [Halomonas sp. DQ26W]|uniref:UDP-N-acetylglucosamine 2-epimerase n=1 Tax=Halomonas sp. DQ26W TaxID=2282311 RepID=UPI000DF7AD7A|nr:UDP-N-acetylglucosamine 2-epimerase [Halomonas sp. DQ26W]RDB42157.1 UDP-N-acetylglucosamine 2-epimerase (hydrolyzing) [Halomonas sp. DQ26W]